MWSTSRLLTLLATLVLVTACAGATQPPAMPEAPTVFTPSVETPPPPTAQPDPIVAAPVTASRSSPGPDGRRMAGVAGRPEAQRQARTAGESD